MNSTCYQLLPGSCFTVDQDGRAGRRDLDDLGVELLHGARVPGEVGNLEPLVQPLRQIRDPAHELLVGEGPLDHGQELLEIERPKLEIVRALSHRPRCELDRARVRDEDHANLGIPALRDVEEAHPVDPVGLELGDHDLRTRAVGNSGRFGRGAIEEIEGLLAVFGPLHVETVLGQKRHELLGLGRVLVDDQRAGTMQQGGSPIPGKVAKR